jgi:mono/diheme cytochrome c family protein
MKATHGISFATLLLLVACGNDNPPATTGGTITTPPQQRVSTQAQTRRKQDFAQVMQGARLFQQYCVSCHGVRAVGVPRWTRPGPDGRYPPPPLNGSAHSWHHPTVALKDFINNGTATSGGNMPAWKDKLSEEQVEAIIAWFQSLWPDEIYARWAQMDAQVRGRAPAQ